jgi:glutamine synthetase
MSNVQDRLRVLFCDHLAIARGKYVTLKPGQGGGARFCRGTFGVTYEKELIPAPGAMVMEGLPDMEAVYTAEDIRPGWQPSPRWPLATSKPTMARPCPCAGAAP